MIEPRGRGVLDHPQAGNDGGSGAVEAIGFGNFNGYYLV